MRAGVASAGVARALPRDLVRLHDWASVRAHRAPEESERALWRQIRDEISAYGRRRHEEPTLPTGSAS